MTETSGSISLLTPADHRDPVKLRSAGRAVMTIEARWGERVHAVIVARPGVVPDADDILAHVGAKLAAYKCPRSIEFRTTMPLSAASNILKAGLRA